MWTQLADLDRWSMGDTVRHLLLRVNQHLIELHDITVHRYAGQVTDPAWPLNDATWKATRVNASLADLDDEAIWPALARFAPATN